MARPNRRSLWIAALVGSVSLQTAQVVAQTPERAPQAAPTPAPAPPASPIARYGYEVVAAYPHDPQAFTQGLVIADGVLTESTGRHPSSVRRVRLTDGEVLTRRDLAPPLFGEGLTVLDGKAFSLTWTDGKIFVWNAADLTPVGEHPLAGQGWGLTHDGRRLILSDGEPHLRFLDPTTLEETGSVPVTINGRPLGRLNELEFIDGEVWANIWQTDFIVRIDPSTGQVKGVVDLTGLLSDPVRDPNDDVLNGIAWDAANKRLFVTGKNWPKLFEIKVVQK